MGLRVSLLGLTLLLAALAGCGRNAEPVAATDDVPPVEERRAFAVPPPSAEAAPGFAYASDGVGELLRERLTPQTLTPDPPAFLTGPRPWRAARLGDDSPRAPFEPAIEAAPRARVLPQERAGAPTRRAVLDVPPLAAEASPSPPSPLFLPDAPLAFAAGPDAGQAPVTELAAQIPARISPGDDPTAGFSRQTAVTLIDLLRTQPAPFMRLTVPDPFEHQRAFPLRILPLEEVAPAMTTARPALPPLPAK